MSPNDGAFLATYSTRREQDENIQTCNRTARKQSANPLIQHLYDFPTDRISQRSRNRDSTVWPVDYSFYAHNLRRNLSSASHLRVPPTRPEGLCCMTISRGLGVLLFKAPSLSWSLPVSRFPLLLCSFVFRYLRI